MLKSKAYKTLTIITVAGFVSLVFTACHAVARHSWSQKHPAQQVPQPIAQHSPHHGPMMGPGHGPMGGWEPGSNYMGMYNLNTVETIRGTVDRMNTFTPMRGMSHGRQLWVRTGNGTVSVHLGPSWYLDRQGFQVSPDDEVTVTGSRINFTGQSTLIAAEVRHGNQTLTLRDTNGIPSWSNWTQQSGQWGPCCW